MGQALPSSGRQIAWSFNEDGHAKEVFSTGSYVCAEDALAGVTLAKAGAGLFQTYRFIVEKDLAEGGLVEVLQKFAGRSRPVSLLYPHGRLLPSRVRAFVDFLTQQFQGRSLTPNETRPAVRKRTK